MATHLKAMAVLTNSRLPIIAALGLMLMPFLGQAQTNHLNQKVSIDVAFVTVDEVLITLSRQGQFNFSYSADVVRGDSIVSLKLRNKTVEKALDNLFGKRLKYKVVNNHILLLPNPDNKGPKRSAGQHQQVGTYTISGFVVDAQTGQALANATVFEVDGQLAANTNSLGYYQLTIPSDRPMRGLNYCRFDYLDSVVFIQLTRSVQIDVPLKPRQTELQKIQTKTTLLEHDLSSRNLVTWLVPNQALNTAQNVSLPQRTTMQVSLLPFVGSDYLTSGAKTNNVSLNILAGYTGGVNGVELGAFANIVHHNVKGAQLAGFTNIVGQNTTGVQAAGFFNVNNGTVTGVQMAGFQNTLNGQMHGVQMSGFNNITTQNVDGVQLTGFVNIAVKDVNMAQLSGFVNWGRNVGGLQATGGVNFAMGNVEAAQLAGMLNVSRHVNGVQAAGFLNVAYGNIGMAQLAGMANYCDSVTGVQMAGFVNTARLNVTALQAAGFVNYGGEVTGAQIAGFTNICMGENKGLQLAGLLNVARKLNGVQIAFLNIADEVEAGVPIGFISIVNKGYHTFELSSDENFYANLTFKLGVKRFYNIFKARKGYNNIMAYSYGAGMLFPLTAKTEWAPEIITSVMHDTRNNQFHLGSMLEFTPLYNYNVAKYCTFFVGPKFCYAYTEQNPETNQFNQFNGLTVWRDNINNLQHQVWVGAQVGYRF
jgi:hypothetical protein